MGDELVEYLEHDIQRLLLALEELDVVDEEHIGFLVMVLEVLVAFLLLVVGCHRVGVIVHQLGGIDVDGAQVRLRLADVVLHRAHEVGLAQPALAVDEQGIEEGAAGGLGHLDSQGIGHLVRFADDEVLEGERRCRAFLHAAVAKGLAGRERAFGAGRGLIDRRGARR